MAHPECMREWSDASPSPIVALLAWSLNCTFHWKQVRFAIDAPNLSLFLCGVHRDCRAKGLPSFDRLTPSASLGTHRRRQSQCCGPVDGMRQACQTGLWLQRLQSLISQISIFHEYWARLRYIPNFWFDLIWTKDSLIHVEDVLLILIGLQKSSEAHHSTLLLPAELTRCQADVNSKYALLYALSLYNFLRRLIEIFEFGNF